MEDIKPKKERKFLKAVGKVAGILLQEFVLGLGRKFIGKKIDIIGNKRQALLIFLALFCNIAFASVDSIPYPITANKQRLGWQTTGNGLVWRGLSADTITKPTSYADKNVKAYLILDSVSGSLYVFKQGVWAAISGAGGGLTMPFDSITFITAKDGTVGVGEVEYNDTQGSLIQGLKGGNVTNVIGQQLHQRVNNKTGAPLAKGDVVYLSGSQGNRITVAKALATSDPTSANTFGIVAESIADNASGYVITEGLITNLNTSALTQDSAVYLSGTTAGALTSTKPQAPIHGVYIGVCVKSNAGSGEIFVKIRNGQELDELHDVQITSPVNNASLYYKSSQGLWRDTTAALLVSDTAAMLANYSLKGYVDSIAQNFQDSIDEITNGYFKQEFPTVTKDTLNWTKPVQLPVGGSNLLLVYRNGQMINDAQYSVIDTNKVKINSGSYKLGENYTVVYVKGGGGSGSGGVPFDTSVLNLQARLDLKLNISDTAAMLANYATKAYADTTGRFYARQDFTNVSSSTLTWTQSDTLVTGGVNVVQVYRNGQILLPSQYTIPSSTSVVIAATSYKAGENYTVIFPRGGGAGSGGGSGSLTSISAGTGITVSPNPITTTGTVSADLSILMELSDTVSLSNRINLKLNATDTASLSNRINLKLNAADTASLSNRINAKQNTITLTTTGTSGSATLVGSTLNIPQYSSGGGSGTVTSVGSGYGLLGGPITTTGTLTVDSATLYDFVRDSIVAVEIGGDTIKILKQEYNNVTSDTLTWTVTSKFPIQLRQFILLFRNGQLLINDQYSVIDTNKIKVSGTSYKLGENYTLVTVSGIGSVSSGQGNPVYPEAGIALSTGTTWTTSIPNNSSNWNTAYTDRLKWDGGSTGLVAATGRTSLGGTTIGQSMFTLTNPSAITFPQFNADNTITALSASSFRGTIGAGTVTSVTASGTVGNPLSITNTTTTPTIELLSATSGRNGYLTSTDWTTFNNKQSQINGTGFVKASGTSITYDNSTYLTTGTAAATYQTILTNPVTGTGTTNTLPLFNGASTLGNSVIQQSSNNIGINTTPYASLTMGQGKNIMLDASSNNIPRILFYETNARNENDVQFGAKIQYNSPSDKLEFVMRDSFAADPSGDELAISIVRQTGNTTIHKTLDVTGATTLGSTLAVTGNITEAGNNVLTNLDTASLSNRINAKGNGTVTNVSGSGAISVATGTTTPVISVADAAFGTAGIVTASGTQQFSGDKTFEGITQFNARAVFKDYSYVATRLAGLSSTDRFATVTIGSGLSLSSGTLSATNTGTVTNVTGTLPISVANGTTTPSITIANASTSASGVVTTGTQSFAGNKTFTGTLDVSSTGTFGGRINTPWLERTYVNSTSSSFTVGVNTTWLDINTNVLTTLTLPNAATYPGKELHIRQTGSGSLQSASANIIPFSSPPTGSTVTSILTASTHRAVTLVSDGTNWIIMQRSDI